MLRRSLTVLLSFAPRSRVCTVSRNGSVDRSGPPRARARRGAARGGIIDASGCGVWVFCLLIERYNKVQSSQRRSSHVRCAVCTQRRPRRAEGGARGEVRSARPLGPGGGSGGHRAAPGARSPRGRCPGLGGDSTHDGRSLRVFIASSSSALSPHSPTCLQTGRSRASI